MPVLLSQSPTSVRTSQVLNLEIFIPAASSRIFRTRCFSPSTQSRLSRIAVPAAVPLSHLIDLTNANKSAHRVVYVVKYPQECSMAGIFVVRNFIQVEFARYLEVNTTITLCYGVWPCWLVAQSTIPLESTVILRTGGLFLISDLNYYQAFLDKLIKLPTDGNLKSLSLKFDEAAALPVTRAAKLVTGQTLRAIDPISSWTVHLHGLQICPAMEGQC